MESTEEIIIVIEKGKTNGDCPSSFNLTLHTKMTDVVVSPSDRY